MLKIIGAGFGRTGTSSLKAALEQIGFGPTYHMSEVFAHLDHVPRWQAAADGEAIDWEDIFGDYQSAVDWPASAFYRQLMDAYRDAKVILTVRDPEKWHQSGVNTIFPTRRWGPDEVIPPDIRAWGKMLDDVLWNGIFEGRVLDREHAVATFKRHITEVTAAVPPEHLLVFDVREGWEPLCAFLGVPVPAEPFPRLNDSASFNERRQVHDNVET